MKRKEHPEQTITAQYDMTMSAQMLKMKEGIKEIIETIKFLAVKGLPLRGHRENSGEEHGQINPDTIYSKNGGMFRDTLKLKIKTGSKALKTHFKIAPKNATYISKDMQNQILLIIGSKISLSIVSEVKIDETADVAGIERMTFVCRYILNGQPVELFLGFIDCYPEIFLGK